MIPVQRVGLYVPGGLAPLASSVIMNVVPAQAAGVESLVVVSPPQRDGLPDRTILAVCQLLGVDEAIVNPNGGAVALGHPIGASGARIVLTAALEMRRRDAELAAAAICGGGGQGDALIVRRA